MREPVVASFGMGTNSAAMLIKMVQDGEPVDAVLAANTGGERPETYEFCEEFSRWLVAHGYPAVTMVRHLLRDGTFQSLEDECLAKGTLPSIAFGFKKCSGKFKLEPQAKWGNHWEMARAAWKSRVRVVRLIGFDVDERRRADKGNEYQSEAWFVRYAAGESVKSIAMSELDGTPTVNQLRNQVRRIHEACKYRKRYPLIERGMGRDDCFETIRAAGLTLPHKSACWFCPSSTKKEILALPKVFQIRAVAMERNAAPNLTSVVGLGRRFTWESVIAGANVQQPESDTEMPCGCTDGDDD